MWSFKPPERLERKLGRLLADKSYPEEARDRLSLNHYLDQIEDTELSFGVQQSNPTNLDEAVATTLQLESYRYPTL